MSSSSLEQALSELLSKRGQTVAEQAEIDAAIAAIVRVMGSPVTARSTPLSEAKQDENESQPTVKKTLPTTSPFYGLGLREAGPKQLTLAGQPQSAREIWSTLDAAGYQTAHGDPTHAVNDAMRRRARTHSDVLLVGDGKWGRTEWYSEAELAEVKKSVGGMGGRDRAAHSEATKTGMIVARNRGAKPGQPKKIKPEMLPQIERMIRSGKSVKEVASEIEVATATIYNSVDRTEFAEWRTEGKEKRKSNTTEDEKVQAKLHVVK